MTTTTREPAQERSSKRGRTDDGESEHTDSPKRVTRKRAALACEECRVRKRRCDGAMPACGGCMKRMSTCVYSSEVQARAWNDGMIQSLRNRLQELTNAESSPQVQAVDRHISDPENVSLTSAPERSSQMRNSTSVPGLEGSSNGDVTGVAGRPQLVGSCTATSPANDPAPLEDGRAAAAQNESPLQCLEPRSFEKLMKPIDEAIDRKCNQARIAPTWAGDPASVTLPVATNCTCNRSLDTKQWCLPLRRHADELVAIYFSRAHRVYPILHQRTFMRQYEQLWQSESSLTGTKRTICSGLCRQKSRGRLFPAMVHAVFALATLFECGPPELNARRADDFFRFAQKIDLLDVLDDEVGIELVQLGLLMGFYLQSTERFSKCWNITGLTIRMAQNMGLQLSLGEARKRGLLAPSATQLECEMQIRVWYGCVLLDREISMSFGRPLMIDTAGNGIRLPEAIDDDRLSEDAGTWNMPSKDQPSLLESYIHTIKLYDILGQVLDREELKESTKNPTATTLSEETSNVLRLDTKILEWRDSLPEYLQYDPSSKEWSHGEIVTSNGIAIPPTDFLAQAKRLYIRFLHVRVLILRPALELLFEKQQHHESIVNNRSMEARLQDLMLSNVAAQCVLCADSLVKLLDAEIQSKSLLAWWYNVSYLHTCGSTILMGQLCTFGDASVVDDSLSASWELCLQCLARYTGLSSIAKKSFHLLQESAKRLLLNNPRPTVECETRRLTDDVADEDDRHLPPDAGYPTPGSQETLPQGLYISEENSQSVSNLLENQPEQECYIQSSKIHSEWDFRPEADLEAGNLEVGNFEVANGELWSNDPAGTSYWPFMPFLSQLETLPSNFDGSMIE